MMQNTMLAIVTGDRMHLPSNLSLVERGKEMTKMLSRKHGTFSRENGPPPIRSSHVPGDVFTARGGTRYEVAPAGQWIKVYDKFGNRPH